MYLRSSTALLIVVALAVAAIPGAAGQERGEMYPRLTTDEMHADVDQLIEVLEEVHPAPYFYVPETEVRKAREELVSELEQPRTQLEFYSLLSRFVAIFQDGHFAVVPPVEALGAYLRQGGKVFPFDIAKSADGVRIAAVYQDSVPLGVGDRLIAINSLAVDSLFDELVTFQSGEPRYRSVRAEKSWRQYLWSRGIRPPFLVAWAHGDQQKVTRLGGATQEQLAEGRKRQGARHYRYVSLEGKVGLIDFRSMQDLERFKDFLRDAFSRIHADSIKGVIVDLRQNGGGDSKLGEALLDYVTNKPYRMASRKEWKVSQRYKDYLRNSGVTMRTYLDAPVGDTLVYEAGLKTPAGGPLRFEGPVCFLIGPGTYSSAVMLANAVEDYQLATLMGEETGGRPNGFGETLRLTLSHSGLRIDVSTARWIRANGDATNKRGVVPDIPITSVGSSGADGVLEHARQWILSQAGNGTE